MSPRTVALTVFTMTIALASFTAGVFVATTPPQPAPVEELRSKLNEVIDRVNLIDSELYELQNKR